jgi:hypothetical protein
VLKVRFQTRLRQSLLMPGGLPQNLDWMCRSLLLSVGQMLKTRPQILLLVLVFRHYWLLQVFLVCDQMPQYLKLHPLQYGIDQHLAVLVDSIV